MLGFIGAVDDNEIPGAAQAKTERLPALVADFAMMLDKAHGQHLAETLQLGQPVGVTPMETKPVDALRVNGAGELAALVPLGDDDFAGLVWRRWSRGPPRSSTWSTTRMKSAQNAQLKQHLQATRAA